VHITGTVLCLELSTAWLGVFSTGTSLCLELSRARLGREVNWYWFVFGT
jgi:hypothetical protein